MPEIQIFKFKNNQPRLDIDAAGERGSSPRTPATS